MRSVDKLRWGLAGGALALLVVLIGYVGYGRYKAVQVWKSRLQRLGIHVDKTTDGFTYSQSLQGRTVFTLHAAKAVQHDKTHWTLHDGVLTLYGHGTNNVERVYGSQFEYDSDSGVARAIGDTEIDIAVPSGVGKSKAVASTKSAGNGPDKEPAKDDNSIHVRTSGLVYVKKLGVAATDQQVDFRYAGLECTSKGAEFNTNESIIHLLADVQLHGDVRGQQIDLHASKADLQRDDNMITMVDPVIVSGGEKAHAANAEVHLRPDGSVETMQATGNVVMEKGTRRVMTARADARFNKDNVPQHAKLTGGVTMDDSDAARPMHATAKEAESSFDAKGEPVDLIAMGGVQVQGSSRNKVGQMLARSMQGARLDATFQPAKKRSELKEVHITGGAQANAEAPVKDGVKKTTIVADDLRAVFYPGTGKMPEVHQVFGDGHTRLEQNAPHGEQQTSTGDKLELQFGQQQPDAPVQVVSAVQTGHVQIHNQPAPKPEAKQQQEPVNASADRSTYDGATEKLVLAGNAKFTQGDTSVAANSVVADQKSGDADAQGGVLATFANAERKGDATHVSADAAHLQHATQLAEFRGTDAHPVRMWQTGSQIQAAHLRLDGKQKTMAARPETPGGLIHAVFSGGKLSSAKPAAGADAKPKDESSRVTRVTANTMDYDDGTRAATFGGNVRVDGATGTVQAKHTVVFLTPISTPATKTGSAANTAIDLSGGSLQRIVIWDDVHLQQPGRTGRGDRLVYTAADSSFVLTGTPGHLPQIVDSERGSVTGTALLFNNGDNTVIVSGGGAGASQDAQPGERGHLRTGSGAKQ